MYAQPSFWAAWNINEISQDENNKSLSKFIESNSILYIKKEVTKIEWEPTVMLSDLLIFEKSIIIL